MSGLPLMTKPMRTRMRLLREAFALLQPQAPFVQFTYAVVPPIPRLAGVQVEASERIWLNLPPARVWVYRQRLTCRLRCGIAATNAKCHGEFDLPPEPRDRLIVALDLPGVREAEAMVARLGDAATFYKVGYQLAFAGGLAFVESLIARRQAGLPRHEAARHREHGGEGRRERRRGSA